MASISKLEAAKMQLDSAIQHFFADEHVCSITLAGAAEDILGGLLQHKGEQSPFEFLHDWYQQEYAEQITKQDFSRQLANAHRNWLKHAKEDAGSVLEITDMDSIMMLMRAVPCYYKLTGGHSTEMDRFNEYVRRNKDRIDAMMSQ